jgi:hypothetical protein
MRKIEPLTDFVGYSIECQVCGSQAYVDDKETTPKAIEKFKANGWVVRTARDYYTELYPLESFDDRPMSICPRCIKARVFQLRENEDARVDFN